MSTPDRVRLDGVVALLGTFPALSGFSLSVPTPQVVVLRGPNGAGKSTVLNVCAGLIPVQRGTVEILGSDVRVDRRSVRKHLGFLGHRTGLYDDLTVEQNVRLAAKASKKSGQGSGSSNVGNNPDANPDANPDVNRLVATTLDRMGLSGRLPKLGVVHLSAGQRRRVALAALVVRRVPLWLLDEPHAALDTDGRDLLDSVIRDAAASGTTVLMASHDLDRADRLAERIVTIVGGRVVADDRVADDRVADDRVADVRVGVSSHAS